VVIRTTHHLKSVRVTEENEILLTSRPAGQLSAAQIQVARRGHWSIEKTHYVRDVTFGEDQSTARTKHAPQNLATLRNRVIGLCGLEAARQRKRTSFLPRFRVAAANDHQIAIDLVARPLLNGS